MLVSAEGADDVKFWEKNWRNAARNRDIRRKLLSKAMAQRGPLCYWWCILNFIGNIFKPKLKSGWLFEWSCLEKQICEKGNKIKNIQGNCTPDYDICTRNKNGNIKNVGSKWEERTKENIRETKTDRIRSQQIRNPAISNQLMSGWKEEENGTNM